jgi:hypothetical protein
VDLEKAGTLSTRDCEDVYHRIRYHLTNAKWEYNVNMRRATFHFILYVVHWALGIGHCVVHWALRCALGIVRSKHGHNLI